MEHSVDNDHIIHHNIQHILSSIRDFAAKYKRDYREIEVMGVSKNQSVAHIMTAFHNGITLFGENRVQEAQQKFSNLEHRPHMHVHVIGTLQRNKVRAALGLFDCIQSIDSLKLLYAIESSIPSQNAPYPVYLQVRCSDFDYKHGFDALDTLKEATEAILNSKNMVLKGLMTIGPFTEQETIIRNGFSKMRKWKEILEKEYNTSIPRLKLSMGMSTDYEWAIAEGSHLIRIGTAIFGAR